MTIYPQVAMQIGWRNILVFILFSGGGVFMIVFARKIAIGSDNIIRWMHGIQRRTEPQPSLIDKFAIWFVFGLGFVVALMGITLLFV